MTSDLFAGIPVSDYRAAADWYERLLGAPPSFLPNESEAVWEVGEHQYVYIVIGAEEAGHAVHLLFVSDLDTRLAAIAERGLRPTDVETYDNGTRKVVFRDPDGNSFGFGGAPE